MKIDESIKESNLDTKSDGDMDFFEDLLDNPEKFGCKIFLFVKFSYQIG